MAERRAEDDGAPLRALGAPRLGSLFARLESGNPRLRVALVVDDAWSALAAAVLHDLRSAPFVSLEQVFTVPSGPDASAVVDATANGCAFPPGLRWMERRRERQAPDETRPERIVADPSAGVPTVSLAHADGGVQGGGADAALKRLEHFDAVLWCARSAPAEVRLLRARFGCWFLSAGRYVAGDSERTRLPEAIRGDGDTEVLLLARLVPDEPPLTLSSAVLRRATTLYIADATHEISWEGQHFFIRALTELHRFGWQKLRERAAARAEPPRTAPVESALRTAGRVVGVVSRKLARRLAPQPKRSERWELSIRPLVDPGWPVSDARLTWANGARITSPADEYWADPFLVEEGGRTLLFFEKLRYGTRRGVISVCEIDARGQVSPSVDCLDLAYHLSYPHVFRHDGEYFLIPESGSAGRVDLYRARRFPDEWVLEKTLFQGLAVDTTCLHRDGRWFFFTSMSDYGNQFPVQMLFASETLTGEWRIHPTSPVSTGVAQERGAGALIEIDGRLIRPTQNNLRGYGHSLRFLEVLSLDSEAYAERTVATLQPDWAPGLWGTHTYARSSRWEIVDYLRRDHSHEP